jgi:NitT/TauT family transport system ATP-binding protein
MSFMGSTGMAATRHEMQVEKPGGDARFEVRDLCVAYRNRDTGLDDIAVENISFSIRPHEFVCMVGASGCGKSSVLNVVAGLLKAASGTVVINGQPIDGPGNNRSVVFQSPALLPWRTALENASYGLELRGMNKREARERAKEMLELVGLADRAGLYPHELSGGMQQRVNLARALAVDPEILLLDEPFAALDAQTRETMQVELLRIWSATRKTSLFVTHQIDEAVLLADRIIVMGRSPGRIREIIAVDLPRPRDEEIKRSRRFMEYEDRIRQLIRDEQRMAE